MYGPYNVFEALLDPVLEWQRQLALKFIEHFARDADTTRIGNAVQANGDVHAITEDVAIVSDDDIAEVDTHP